MTSLRSIVCCFLAGVSLVSCRADQQAATVSCSMIGQRVHEQPLRGVIYGSVGAKAEVNACPGVRLPFAFVGEDPADYRRLTQLAEQRQDVLGFNAMADGYIVTDGPGQYVLLLITLDNVREDPSVAKAARDATG